MYNMKKGLIKKVVACALLGIMTMGFVGCGAADNKTTDGNRVSEERGYEKLYN